MSYIIKLGQIYSELPNGQQLKADLYLPDDTANRKCVILAHGGGFFRGSRKEDPIKSYAMKFAEAGYVAVSIDYRLSLPSVTAVQQGVQDMLASVRWVRSQATKYLIDEESIFVGGTSAGGLCAVGAAYMNPSDFNSGNVNHSNEGYSNQVKAVGNLWGAILRLDYIEQTEAPIINIYGKSDTTVPPDCGTSFFVSCCGGHAISAYCASKGIENIDMPFDGKHGLGKKTSTTYQKLLDKTFSSMLNFFNSL